VLVEQILPAFAEKVDAVRLAAAHPAGRGQTARFQQRVAGGGDHDELVVAPERVVGLENVLVVRIVDVTEAAYFRAISGRKSDSPTIRDRNEIILRQRSWEGTRLGVA